MTKSKKTEYTQTQIDELIAQGGKNWQDKRIYFNLDVKFYYDLQKKLWKIEDTNEKGIEYFLNKIENIFNLKENIEAEKTAKEEEQKIAKENKDNADKELQNQVLDILDNYKDKFEFYQAVSDKAKKLNITEFRKNCVNEIVNTFFTNKQIEAFKSAKYFDKPTYTKKGDTSVYTGERKCANWFLRDFCGKYIADNTDLKELVYEQLKSLFSKAKEEKLSFSDWLECVNDCILDNMSYAQAKELYYDDYLADMKGELKEFEQKEAGFEEDSDRLHQAYGSM